MYHRGRTYYRTFLCLEEYKNVKTHTPLGDKHLQIQVFPC